MAYDPADLVRRFEPILYFAKGERFVPSDCKRYLERSALWNCGKPRDAKTSWGQGGPGFPRKPAIARGRISALPGEPSLTGSGQFLGQSKSGQFPFLIPTGGSEFFLDLTGWKDDGGVTKSSENRFADVDDIAVLYQDVAAGGDPFLAKSRLWYHAEIFDALRMRPLLAPEGRPRDIKDLFSTLVDPLLLCYYLFFPAHDEGIVCSEGFPDTEMFGSFAGEWACFAILLRGNGQQEQFEPVAAGLTSRNVGKIGFLGGERRVGMRIHDWSTLTRVSQARGPNKAPGDHVRLFVAKGTHGLYSTPGDQPIPPFAPTDSAREFCGVGEMLEKSIEELDREDKEARDSYAEDSEVILAKYAFGGPILGGLLAGLEFAAAGGAHFGTTHSTPVQFDHPPPEDKAGSFGAIISPRDVDPPNDEGAVVSKWPSLTDEPNLNTAIDGRLYSLLVRRTDPNPDKRQLWWPALDHFPGFSGRWGPRVERDPNTRRAGMMFPEFWTMFMSAFAKAKAGS